MFQYLVAFLLISLWIYAIVKKIFFPGNIKENLTDLLSNKQTYPTRLTINWVILMMLIYFIDNLTGLGSLANLNKQFAKIILGENKE